MRPFQSDQITAWFPGGVLLLYRLFHTPLSEGGLLAHNYIRQIGSHSMIPPLSLCLVWCAMIRWTAADGGQLFALEHGQKISESCLFFFSRQRNEISLFKHSHTHVKPITMCLQNLKPFSSMHKYFGQILYHAGTEKGSFMKYMFRFEVDVQKINHQTPGIFFCHRPKIWKKIKNWKLQSPGVSFDIWSSQ